MKETFYELVNYLKNPVLEKDANQTASHKATKFFHLFIISIITGALLTPVFLLIEHLGWVNMNDHAMEELMKNLPKYALFLFAVVLAPLFEEVIFRAPLTLFDGKKTFKISFYVFAIVFGLIHITNFKITTNVLLLTPILVAPQIILGGYLGFIRIRFGLLYSILLHACYNAFFMLVTFAST